MASPSKNLPPRSALRTRSSGGGRLERSIQDVDVEGKWSQRLRSAIVVRAGADPLEEQYGKEFVKNYRMKSLSTLSLPPKSAGIEEDKSARNLVIGQVERKVKRAATDIPILEYGNFTTINDLISVLERAYPGWSNIEHINAGCTFHCNKQQVQANKRQKSKGASSSSTSKLITYRDKGLLATSSKIDLQLPEPVVADEKAEEIWPEALWNSCVGGLSPGQAMSKMLEKITFKDCVFKLLDVSTVESVCGKGLKPDVILVLSGYSSTEVSATGAIICLHSKGDNAACKSPFSTGEAVTYAQAFLREVGPTRYFVIVGLTDLKEITWYRISTEVDQVSCTRSVQIEKVRASLCAYLHSEATSLGVNLITMDELPSGWKMKGLLGSGRTSTVHEVEAEGQKCALKVPKCDEELCEDFIFLSILNGIDGVPRIHSQLKGMLILQPVGVEFSLPNLIKHGLTNSLGDLVDILEAAQARNVVNRDIRLDNIMIAECCHNQGQHRLYLLDWGFAATCGASCPFCGSLCTASDQVLQQILKKKENSGEVVVCGADDLVSLVRCIFLFNRPHIVEKLMCTTGDGDDICSYLKFWEKQMEGPDCWQEAEGNTREGKYAEVKKFFKLWACFN